MTKGWFKVVAPTEDNSFLESDDTFTAPDGESDEENERWYYADGDGALASGEIKKFPNDEGGIHCISIQKSAQ